jgi:hypothetical protein
VYATNIARCAAKSGCTKQLVLREISAQLLNMEKPNLENVKKVFEKMRYGRTI